MDNNKLNNKLLGLYTILRDRRKLDFQFGLDLGVSNRKICRKKNNAQTDYAFSTLFFCTEKS